MGDAATPVDKMGLLTNDFLLLRELELKKGGKSRRGNEMTEFPDMPKPGGKSASLPGGNPACPSFSIDKRAANMDTPLNQSTL